MFAFAAEFVFAVLFGAVAFVFAGCAVFACAFVFAVLLTSAAAGGTVVSVTVSGLLFKTELPPCKAGIAINKAESIKSVAATIVIFDKIVCVPRG